MQWTAWHKKNAYDAEIAKLSHLALALFVMIRPHCDAKGRFSADPVLVKAQCVPLFDFTLAQVDDALNELDTARKIHLYVVGDSRFLVYHDQADQPTRGLKWAREEWPAPPVGLCSCFTFKGGPSDPSPSPTPGPNPEKEATKGVAGNDVANDVGDGVSHSHSHSHGDSFSSGGDKGIGEKGGADPDDYTKQDRELDLELAEGFSYCGELSLEAKVKQMRYLRRICVPIVAIREKAADPDSRSCSFYGIVNALEVLGNGKGRGKRMSIGDVMKQVAKDLDAEEAAAAAAAQAKDNLGGSHEEPPKPPPEPPAPAPSVPPEPESLSAAHLKAILSLGSEKLMGWSDEQIDRARAIVAQEYGKAEVPA